MSLARKFIIAILSSIFFIATVNVLAFYIFYTTFLQTYLIEKNNSRDEITIEYINEVIKKQTIDEIDSIFSDTEIEFFELLEDNDWEIPLDEQQNIDTVINYLVENWIAPKYIEEIIPTDNFWKVLEALKDENSPESKFISKLTIAIIITNIIAIWVIIWLLIIFIRHTIHPVKQVTKRIKDLDEEKNLVDYKTIQDIYYYNKKDEIWLLIRAINNLNKKISLQDDIRTRLLADISHELKTPITSIQCYLEWISDWIIKLDQKNLNSITDEMSRLISLVNKIMEYEKLERKEIDLELTEFNIKNLIISLVETHKKRLKENKQRIKVSWAEELLLKADKDLFIQLVHNLIWNFLKYAWNNTILRINITKNYIEFTDDWVWVKSTEIPFLTEKFYQSNTAKTWNIESRWIWVWLSIISKIIKSHSWKYEIKTEEWKWFSFKLYI